jgi:glutathione S-transferase
MDKKKIVRDSTASRGRPRAMAETYRLHGANPSPYSRKMRAIMRYRRLPFIWDNDGTARDVAIKAQLPPVIPVLTFPDGRLMNDSTPLAYELERLHAERSILPDDPALAFLSDLIEDFADEWVTKIMFHYRWFYADDRKFAQLWITGDRMIGVPPEKRQAAMTAINGRQVGRMALVGCTEANRPIIEESYFRLLDILNAHVPHMPFLFGSRPSLADFGLFGQLIILATDPTPETEMRRRAPDVLLWLMRLDDASGVEGAWIKPTDTLPQAVTELLRLAGDYYLPFLAANNEAFGQGDQEVVVTLTGQRYAQAPFRYQVKCYDGLRKKFAALPPAARKRLEPVLTGSGCLRWLA